MGACLDTEVIKGIGYNEGGGGGGGGGVGGGIGKEMQVHTGDEKTTKR